MIATAAPARYRFVPTYSSSAGQDCIDLAEFAGLTLDPWQQDVLRDALAQGPNGMWLAMRVALIVPRQNGKGGILEALELWNLYANPTCELITHTAHRFDTCLDHFRRIRTLVEDTPELLAQVDDSGRRRPDGGPSGIKDSNGKESILLKNGARLNFKAREKGSGRGFSGDLVVLDEAFYLGDLSGLIPTMSARVNPQVWYASSAPLPRSESDNLRRIIRTGRSLCDGRELGPREKPLTYFEWSAPEGSTVDDEAALRAANPSMEVGRITADFAYGVELPEMGEEAFARERLGIFPDDDAALWELFDEDAWKGGEVPAGNIAGPHTYAVEVTPDRDRCSVAVAGVFEDRVGVEVVYAGPYNEDDVLSRLVAVAGQARGIVVEAGGPAGTLIRPLKELHDIDVHAAGVSELALACQSFYDHHKGDLAHSADDPALDGAVAAARKRKRGDGFTFDRNGRDVTPLTAAALARWGHLEIEEPPPRSVYEDREPLTL